MKPIVSLRVAATLGVAALLFPVVALAADPAAAQRQYRIARRLVVEGSPEAVAALKKVIELDPQGALADDSLVDQALLLGVPRWPEEIGGLDAIRAHQARKLLSRVTDEFSLADRAPEARYLRALLRLEPLPSHDASDAGLELVTVATAPEQGEWSRAARYTLGWLAEQQVKESRAREAYQRLAVDEPESTAAARAQVGLARLALRDGRHAEAARWLRRADEAGAPEELRGAALRELATRLVLIESGRGIVFTTPPPRLWNTGIGSLLGMAVTPDGGVLLADSKTRQATRLDSAGKVVAQWPLANVQALAVDPLGNAFAAAGDAIYLLANDQSPRSIAAQGEFGPPDSLAADGAGRLWMLDRKGTAIVKVEPGSGIVVPFVEVERRKLTGLGWDGRRLVALDTRDRVVVAIGADGAVEVVTREELPKPAALAVGPAGHVALIDNKNDAIFLFASSGKLLGSFSWEGVAVQRPTAIGLGVDGSITLFDEASKRCVRLP